MSRLPKLALSPPSPSASLILPVPCPQAVLTSPQEGSETPTPRGISTSTLWPEDGVA